MTRLELIRKTLKTYWPEDIVDAWNRCVDETGDGDAVFSMGELEDELYGYSRLDVRRLAYDGDLNPYDDWWCFEDGGDPVSSNDPMCWIDTDVLTEYMDDADEACGLSDIDDILEAFESDEDITDELIAERLG